MNHGLPSDLLIFDWSTFGPHRFETTARIAVNDETLREGLQNPSVLEPPFAAKLEILRLMEQLGIENASMGIPCAGIKQFQDALDLCREIAANNWRLRPSCGGRTLIADVVPIVEVSRRSGVRVEAFLFTGSSPLRQLAEQWSLADILKRSHDSIIFAVQEGLEVNYITEDTTRATPEQLRYLLTCAIEAGARHVCLCDTAGAATIEGVMNLVRWVREIVGPEIGIDWHGHNDRGLGLANALAAIRAGATRVHATALGLGERTGNTPMEQLLVNLRLLGLRQNDLTLLPTYINTVSRSVDIPIPSAAPVVGRDAFRTATGTHAAAVAKALVRDDIALADQVYSGVPASWLGRTQKIEIGPLSGKSNVHYFLRSHKLPEDPDLVQAILDLAKLSSRILSEQQILDIAKHHEKGVMHDE